MGLHSALKVCKTGFDYKLICFTYVLLLWDLDVCFHDNGYSVRFFSNFHLPWLCFSPLGVEHTT